MGILTGQTACSVRVAKMCGALNTAAIVLHVLIYFNLQQDGSCLERKISLLKLLTLFTGCWKLEVQVW